MSYNPPAIPILQESLRVSRQKRQALERVNAQMLAALKGAKDCQISDAAYNILMDAIQAAEGEK